VEDLEARVRKIEQEFAAFAQEIRLAYRYIRPDAASSLTKSRIVMEKLLLKVYKAEMGKEPRKPLLGDMLADNQFTRKIDRRILSRMNAIRDMGNLGPHGESVQPNDAERVLDDLCTVLDWCLSRYASKMRKRRGSSEASAAGQPTAPAPVPSPQSNADQPTRTPAAAPSGQPAVLSAGLPKAKSKGPVIGVPVGACLALCICSASAVYFVYGLFRASAGPDGANIARTGRPTTQGTTRKDFTNSLGMQFVLLPKATFWMGDIWSQRQVEITSDFYIGVFLVTQEQWQAVMDNNPSQFSRQGLNADKVKEFFDADLKQFPVESVSFDDVQDFLKRLNAHEKNSGFLYRLPTEAEWE
jgi:hypothetical protein